jgi:hypothetical protein
MYPFTTYFFRVRNKAGADPGRPRGKTFTTLYRLTEAEARERYEVVERLDWSAQIITGPAPHTSAFLTPPRRSTLQDDDIPDLDLDL